ncbi:hypothetical protein OUZ56_026680 [Daphnia magna]|uniref:Uncharacterized protein n=1 Tax=Daphnia magna TaxID=35525 RepID=A0ABQ9ZNH0_9CRUS|nr:hypothetical protein OUZ56_026680 [Daphnia magna]
MLMTPVFERGKELISAVTIVSTDFTTSTTNHAAHANQQSCSVQARDKVSRAVHNSDINTTSESEGNHWDRDFWASCPKDSRFSDTWTSGTRHLDDRFATGEHLSSDVRTTGSRPWIYRLDYRFSYYCNVKKLNTIREERGQLGHGSYWTKTLSATYCNV